MVKSIMVPDDNLSSNNFRNKLECRNAIQTHPYMCIYSFTMIDFPIDMLIPTASATSPSCYYLYQAE